MRLILTILALWQVRLGRLDPARGTRLMDDAEAAFAQARQRFATASALSVQAGYPPLPRRLL